MSDVFCLSKDDMELYKYQNPGRRLLRLPFGHEAASRRDRSALLVPGVILVSKELHTVLDLDGYG
jgi:hypothetical protein